MKGARLGMLPPEYGEKGSRVLDGIRDTYLKKGEQAGSFTASAPAQVWDRDRTTAPTAPAPRSII